VAVASLKLFPGTAGVPPARVREAQASGLEFMVRGRDARGPREELECLELWSGVSSILLS
jgi:hypothetical protein